MKPRPFQNTLSFVFDFSVLNVGSVVAQEESKTNCHQCQSTTLDATSAADAWRGKPLPLQARTDSSLHKQGKKGTAKAQSIQHIISQILQRTLHAQLTACCFPITSHSVLWQPLQDGRSAQTLQQWATTMAAVQCLPRVLHLPFSIKQRPRCMRSCVPCNQKLTP